MRELGAGRGSWGY